ncbi:MAG: hypothetical protein LQ351_007375 [Letrouitia transgressa]|nr:MAG: hypothetical protein LQ351_007375 [Letrouitia transgressa]
MPGDFSNKATAAHVAFTAPSRSVVDQFFVAALKAGGRIHGEPAVRDQETGYYSAAVMDFDDNSIEAMHRDKATSDHCGSTASLNRDRVRSWQKEVAKSTSSQIPWAEKEKPQIAIGNITVPTVTIAQPLSQTKSSGNIDSKALVGTLLGAAAGAAFAYAMTKSEGNNGLQAAAYQMIEASNPSLAPSAASLQQSHPASVVSRTSQSAPKQLEYGKPATIRSVVSSRVSSSYKRSEPLALTAQPHASTLIDTFIPPSEIPRYHHQPIPRSQSDSLVQPKASSRTSSHGSRRSKHPYASSTAQTVMQPDISPSKDSSVVTEVRYAKEIPLPQSRTTSTASRHTSDLRRTVLAHGNDDAAGSVLESLAPSDSISQAGSRKSHSSKRSNRHHGSKGKENSEKGSLVSDKTIKGGGDQGKRRESILTLAKIIMDPTVQRLLNDKLYDRRKQGALDLERIVREASANQEHEKIAKVIDQLCRDFAYAVHQPHARNGGLIGLAAASIALGSEEVARYLKEIVPPVLACFSDQDARVRYYACESMYNIAKVAKGEMLLFFNDVFDALSKLVADSETSVKNGAELLDRLIKDIVSESASTYVSILHPQEEIISDKDSGRGSGGSKSFDLPTAFSLANFIPLLEERIHVMNPFTRTFLVSWVKLLDTIPDLELVTYLPAFLGGLFGFLSDSNRDVCIATQGVLEGFLNEIKKIARIKRGIAESRRSQGEGKPKRSDSSDSVSIRTDHSSFNEKSDTADADSWMQTGDGDWIPGQDVQVNHSKLLEILIAFLERPTSTKEPAHDQDPSLIANSENAIQLTALRWIDHFFEICPEDILAFVPSLLSKVLPAMASDDEVLVQAANRVNSSLMDFIESLPNDASLEDDRPLTGSHIAANAIKDTDGRGGRSSTPTLKVPQSSDSDAEMKGAEKPIPSPPTEITPGPSRPGGDLNYSAAVGALTLHFLHQHEATRVASLSWLIMLHRRAPRKVLATNDGTFPALLKTLSDPAEAVVTRDLQLLSQISKNSEDGYFISFMTNLLQLFCTDRNLLETRCNLIIRQLCVSLSAERIYRTLADCLEKDEDMEFASIMVQKLNNNLITAPELAESRKRLRNLETRDGQTFFVALFRAWCHNAVATFSLCLLAQAYEQAYNLLQVFAELEMTVNMLIQIDKLVQLLESPVFTYLRLQLLEPEKHPHLYKCLYGLLMLLPQSSAFAALKNRLNSVSAIGYLHIAPRGYVSSQSHVRQKSTELKFGSTSSTAAAGFDRPNRLKAREDSAIRWVELLEKFKSVQERSRRTNRSQNQADDGMVNSSSTAEINKEKALPEVPKQNLQLPSGGSGGGPRSTLPTAPSHKQKSSLSSNLGRFTGGVGSKKQKK